MMSQSCRVKVTTANIFLNLIFNGNISPEIPDRPGRVQCIHRT